MEKEKKRLLERISLTATSKKNGRHKQSAFLKSESSDAVGSERLLKGISQRHGATWEPRRRRSAWEVRSGNHRTCRVCRHREDPAQSASCSTSRVQSAEAGSVGTVPAHAGPAFPAPRRLHRGPRRMFRHRSLKSRHPHDTVKLNGAHKARKMFSGGGALPGGGALVQRPAVL